MPVLVVRWVWERWLPLDLRSGCAGSAARLDDRTASAQLHDDLTTLFEGSTNGEAIAGSIVDIARAIVLVLDPTGHVLYYHRFFEELSGVPLGEARGTYRRERHIAPLLQTAARSTMRPGPVGGRSLAFDFGSFASAAIDARQAITAPEALPN